jgi:alanine-synthesizing transaminase
MFSRRTPPDFAENALARRIKSMRDEGAPILDLTESNPTRAGFLAPSELLTLLASPTAARYAPEARGLASARRAVSADYAARGVAIGPENLVLTASSSESYSFLFKLLTDPGDEVLVPAPSYPLFGYLADLDGVRVRTYPLSFDGEWHLSIDALRPLIGVRTRALVVVHPNNPTGSFLKREEAAGLTTLCAERGVAIIADEVFADFILEGDLATRHSSFALPSQALCFALGGLSKSCALPQMKLGWIAASGPPALREEALTRLEFIADSYLSAATPIQLALPTILEEKAALQAPIRARLTRNLLALKTAVAARGELRLLPVEGGWSALIQCPATRSDEERALLALEAFVLAHPGHFFDFESGCYLVVSLLCDPDVFDEALPRLAEAAVR